MMIAVPRVLSGTFLDYDVIRSIDSIRNMSGDGEFNIEEAVVSVRFAITW